jgi:PHD/YefM family antitoxin component YafN of YafNO toxin-antitoxin module
MTTVTVPASQVRVPNEAREAVNQREPVTVMSHQRSQYVILHPDDYALVSPILECNRAGRPISVERLLTDDDFAIMREELSDAADEGVLESWAS